jgi:RNA polymerase sigma-70 factor (ECF subfamily)
MDDFNLRLIDAIPGLRRYALSIVRNRADADDLVHTTLERALRKQHLYEPTGSFIGWLTQIMRRSHIDSVRRSKIVPMISRDSEATLPEPAAPADQVETRYIKELGAEIAALPEVHREMLTLFAHDGLSYEQAAERLALPLGTVRSRLFRARGALRARIGADG